jgi:hypothetical protein
MRIWIALSYGMDDLRIKLQHSKVSLNKMSGFILEIESDQTEAGWSDFQTDSQPKALSI